MPRRPVRDTFSRFRPTPAVRRAPSGDGRGSAIGKERVPHLAGGRQRAGRSRRGRVFARIVAGRTEGSMSGAFNVVTSFKRRPVATRE